MSKYKLINKQTGEEHLCDKVTIDGFDYYVSDEKILTGDYKYHHVTGLRKALVDGNYTNQKKVIATNNPNIDIPKVADEIMSKVLYPFSPQKAKHFIKGYNKSQETHPFSEEDIKEIFKIAQMQKNYGDYKPYTFEEAIQLWKEQRTKTLYYE